MYKLTIASFLLAGVAACATPDQDLDKDRARQLAGKADHVFDYCAAFDWYGDGICDDFCLEPDPDCAELCGDGSMPVCEIVVQPCPVGLIREVQNGCFGECVDPETCEAPIHPGVCGDGTPALCAVVPEPCADGLIREIVNHCFGQCVNPTSCLPPPQVVGECTDGTVPVCEIFVEPCADGMTRAIVDGCFGDCVDPETCLAPPDL